MNEKLTKFLDKKRKEELDKLRREKTNNLIELGLYDKVYSPDNAYSDEYELYEWDSENNIGKYYKIVPIEITDDEYQEVKKYQKNEQSKEKNVIASALVASAWFVFIGGFIAGIMFGNGEVYKEVYGEYIVDTEFSIGIAFVYWGVCFISGIMFLGFAEIIKLLDAIKKK